MTLRRNRHTRNHSCGIDGLIGACMHRAKNIEVARVDRATSIVAIRRFMRTSSRRDPGPAEACCTDDSCRRIAQGRRSCRAADRGCRRQEHRFQIQCKRDDHGPGSPGAREPAALGSGVCGLGCLRTGGVGGAVYIRGRAAMRSSKQRRYVCNYKKTYLRPKITAMMYAAMEQSRARPLMTLIRM
jgi:hypothetical protein